MRVSVRVALLAVAAADVGCVALHWDGLQTSRFWHWPWRHAPTGALLAAMVGALTPLMFAVWRWGRGLRPAVALALLSLSLLITPAAGLIVAYRPITPLLPALVVEDRAASSYWADARRLMKQGLSARQVMTQYPHWLPYLYVHTRNKPPGFVMFYYALLEWFGRNSHGSAIFGAACIAIGTAIGVPVVYRMACSLHGDADAAFWAAVLFALTPIVSAIYPQFDSCFPGLVCATVMLWLAAMRGHTVVNAVLFGVVLAGSLLFTSNLLVLGTLFLSLAVWQWQFGDTPDVGRRFWIGAGAVVATLAAFYTLLWCATGYNPIATMRTVWAIERDFETVVVQRPWPQIVPSDFVLFFFGTGLLLPLLAIAGCFAGAATPQERGPAWAMRVCLLQILLVGCTGLLRGETTRIWCFLVPLLTIPAGVELSRWPRVWRLTAIGLMAALAIVMVQNVEFNSFAAR